MLRPSLLVFLCCLMAMASFAPAAEWGLIDGMQWTDGGDRSMDDLQGQTVLIVYFSGQCPGCARMMETDVAELGQLIERNQMPARLVCVTPDMRGEQLAAWQQRLGLGDALVAHDPHNRMNISLGNIYQFRLVGPDGRQRRTPIEQLRAAFSSPANADELGTYRFDLRPVESEQLRQVWWAIERGNPEGVEALEQAARHRNFRDEAGPMLERLEAILTERVAPLLEAEPSMETFEALEELVLLAGDLDSMDDAARRLRQLSRDDALEDELRARQAYRAIQELLGGHTNREREQGMAAMAELIERYPDTLYGRRAAEQPRY